MNRLMKRYFLYLSITTITILLFVVPLLLLISFSITDEVAFFEDGHRLIPRVVSFAAYEVLLQNFSRYFSLVSFTFIQASISTFFSLIVMTLGAYVLSRDKYVFSRIANIFVFGAYFLKWGFVATFYINTRILNLFDSFWIYIFPNLVDVYFLLILRSYYSKIGKTLLRSAEMDGAGEANIFLNIALPISLPLILAVGVLLFINRWNDWFTSMLYINDGSLFTLHYYLQRISREEGFIRDLVRVAAGSDLSRNMPMHTLRFAVGVVSTIPLLFLTPLFRKAATYCNFSLE